MPIFVFNYGALYYAVRVGFTASRPLIYAVYRYNDESELPKIIGQTYRSIDANQYDWLLSHLFCNVSFIDNLWPFNTLECRTCGLYYKVLRNDIPDLWDERQV